MKKVIQNLMMQLAVVVACALLLQSCSSELAVTAPPPPPQEVIVAAPSSRHVWIPGRYVYSRSSGYAWRNGYYRTPPPRKPIFIPGHWEQTPRGFLWRDGYWIRG